VTVRGRVAPPARGKAVVTLFRKQGGAFVRIESKTPAFGKAGAYAATFARPRSGACKATVKYGGDGTHLPSQASAMFRC
jgi:hypothetical protein